MALSGLFVFPADGALLVAVAATSFVACGLLIATRGLHGHRSAGLEHLGAVQAAHVVPTPRLGGVGLLLGFLTSLLFASAHLQSRGALLALSCCPLIAAGVLEDLGYKVRPSVRLLAAAVGSALVIFLMERWLVRFDMPLVDQALAYFPVAVLVTIFCTTAVSHAFNLIDGVNGLSAGVAFCASLAMAVIAHGVGDAALVELLLFLAAAIFGFLVWNFPAGKIFLGDTGAYVLGHLLSWVAIALVWRNPQVSAWALLLILLWPIADTTLAIWRRMRRRTPIGAPDNRHMHQLVLFVLETAWLGRGRRRLSNPLTTLALAPFFVTPMVCGVLLYTSKPWSFVAAVVLSVAYVVAYGVLVMVARKVRRPLTVRMQQKAAPEPAAV